MRDRWALTLLLKVLLTLESIALLAPVTLILMMAGVVAFGGLLPDSDFGYTDWRGRLQALGITLVPFVFGTIALAEVSRILIATLHDVHLVWSRRTTLSAVSGAIATIAGGVGFYVMGQNQTSLGAAIVALEFVVPVLLLCCHLWWLQVRLGRAAAAP